MFLLSIQTNKENYPHNKLLTEYHTHTYLVHMYPTTSTIHESLDTQLLHNIHQSYIMNKMTPIILHTTQTYKL